MQQQLGYALVTPGSRKKKPPACDACKARRVLCHSQPAGIPCPRCVEKGIACTTTPVVRRKPGKRSKADSGPAPSENPCEPGSSDVNIISSLDESSKSPSTSSIIELSSRSLEATELSASLVLHLFDSFRYLPQYFHPAIPYSNLRAELQRCSWRPAYLEPQAKVLAYCIIAVAALISTHPYVIGPGAAPPLPTVPLHGHDFRSFGRRRHAMCQLLRNEALALARLEGIATEVSLENAASCYLLDFLESGDAQPGSRSYASAFVSHVRTLIGSPEMLNDRSIFEKRQLQWSSFLMNEALVAVYHGKPILFTHYDELLICDADPPPLEQVCSRLSLGSIGVPEVFDTIRPFAFHVTRLAREGSEQLTGVHARRNLLNEAFLLPHLASLELLHATLDTLLHRIHALLPVENNPQLTFLLQAYTYSIAFAWASLVLPIHLELRRRMCESTLFSNPPEKASVRGWERLELLHRQVRGMALNAATFLARHVYAVTSLPRLTHVQYCKLTPWVCLLLEEEHVPEISVVERIEALERFASGLKLVGFSWVDDRGIVEAIEARLHALRLQHGFSVNCPAPGSSYFAETVEYGSSLLGENTGPIEISLCMSMFDAARGGPLEVEES